MRNNTNVLIISEEFSFIDLVYYDGVKLQVDIENSILLVWYDYGETEDIWFKIEGNDKLFKEYISNQVSLLDVLRNSQVFLCKRDYKRFDVIEECEKINTLDNYLLPDSDAYLGFKFIDEQEYSYHLFKGYRKKVVYDEKKSKERSIQNEKINYTYNSNKQWRVNVAA